MDRKKILIFIFAVLMLLGISFRLLYLNKDFTGEEVDFVKAAEGIAKTGHPVYYYSERSPNQVALAHPPMYIYLLSLILKFSQSEPFVRIVNVTASLILALMIFLFCFSLIGGKKGKMIGIIASSFYLINFYALTSSVLIDIDMFSSLFLFSFLFFILAEKKYDKKYFYLLAGLSFFLALWNRFQIALMLYFLFGLYHLKKPFRNKLKYYILMGIAAVSSFIIAWALYSLFVEPGNFFSFLVHNAYMSGNQFSDKRIYFGSFTVNIIQFVRFFTFPGVVLMLFSFFYFIKNKSIEIRLLMIYSLSILLIFTIFPRPAFGITRYFASAFPGIFVLISIFLYENLKDFKIDEMNIAITTSTFLLSLILLIILSPYVPIYRTDGLVKSMNIPDLFFNIFASFPIFSVFFFKKHRKEIFLLVLASLFLSYSLYFDVSMVNKKPYIKEVGEYIQERTQESEFLIAPEAVGYYAERRFYENDHSKPNIKLDYEFLKEYFAKCIENRNMNEEFFWPGGYFSGVYYPMTDEKAQEVSYLVAYHQFYDKEYEAKIGDYYIYNLKD